MIKKSCLRVNAYAPPYLPEQATLIACTNQRASEAGGRM